MTKRKGNGGRLELPFPPGFWGWSRFQRRVWNATLDLDRPKLIVLTFGRGAGKDVVADRCMIRDLIALWGRKKKQLAAAERGDAGARAMVTNPMVAGWLIAPADANLAQTRDDWNGELRRLARHWGTMAGYEEENTEWLFRRTVRDQQWTLFGEGEIEVGERLSSTKNALRGPGIDLVKWTEFAMETSPGEIGRAWKEELRGTTTRAGRLGRIYLTTTPKGPFGEFHEEMRRLFGEDVFEVADGVEGRVLREWEGAGRPAGWRDEATGARVVEGVVEGAWGERWSEDGLGVFFQGDSFCCEYLTEDQEALIRGEAGGWEYVQERRARMVIADMSGDAAFGRKDVEKCVVPAPPVGSAVASPAEDDRLAHRRPAGRGPRFRRIRVGVDIARFGDDFTVYCGVDIDTGEIVYLERKKHADGQEVVSDLERIAGMFPGCEFLVDDTGHRGYVSDFAPRSMNITGTQFSRAKEKWVGGLKMLFQMGRLRIPDPERYPGLSPEMRAALRELLKEVLSFQRVVKQSGAVEYRHPKGMHDDCVDALMLGTMEMAGELRGKVDAKGNWDKVARAMV